MGLREEIDDLKDEVKKLNQEENKGKPMILPFKAWMGRAHLRKNYIRVAFIHENLDVDLLKVPVNEGTYMIGDQPYIATPEYMMTYRGKPFIIQPQWSTHPFNPNDNADDTNIWDGYSLGVDPPYLSTGTYSLLAICQMSRKCTSFVYKTHHHMHN